MMKKFGLVQTLRKNIGRLSVGVHILHDNPLKFTLLSNVMYFAIKMFVPSCNTQIARHIDSSSVVNTLDGLYV